MSPTPNGNANGSCCGGAVMWNSIWSTIEERNSVFIRRVLDMKAY